MYKKLKIVALPTENLNHVTVPFVKFKGKFIEHLAGGEFRRYIKEGGLAHHLYIISEDKVLDHDWVLVPEQNGWKSKIWRYIGGEYYTKDGAPCFTNSSEDFKKIVATTDRSLKTSEHEFTGFCGEEYYKSLPKIPDYFVSSYVKNPVEEVLVEYDCISSVRMRIFDFSKDPIEIDCSSSECIEAALKLKDNEIIIESYKISWSKEELYPILEEVMSLGIQSAKHKKDSETYTEILNNWKKENL